MVEHEVGDYLWYDGGDYKAYKPGVCKIVDFYGRFPVVEAITNEGRVGRVVALGQNTRKLTKYEKVLYENT